MKLLVSSSRASRASQGKRARRRAVVFCSGVGLLVSCGSTAVVAQRKPPAVCSTSVVAKGPEQAALEVHLQPLPTDVGGEVSVSVEVTARAETLASFQVPRALAHALDVNVTRHRSTCAANGTPNVERLALRGEPGATLQLDGVAALDETVRVRLDYRIPAAGFKGGLWQLDQDRFVTRGEAILVLPNAPGFAADTLVDVDVSAYGASGRAVSSLGLGEKPRTNMTLRALSESVFAAGYLGSAVFDAAEGYDEAAWFGSTAFDPRPLSAEVASFRTAVRDLFRNVRPRPLTLVMVVERSREEFEVTRAPGSVLARVGLNQPLSARLRLGIFHQVMKEWIGGQLTLADENGAELVWFTEGICRFLARELAFEFGLITPLELAEEVNAVMAIQAVLSQKKHRAGCASPSGTKGALAGCSPVLQLARGVLHAGQLDAVLRARQSSLVALLGELLSKGARAMTSPEWAEALRQAGGPAAVSLQEGLASAQVVLPPSGAFGACFVREPARYAESLLGFEHEPAPAAAPGLLVTTLDGKAPAFAAGLREGARVTAIDHAPHEPERPIRVELDGGGAVEYRGVEAWVAGSRWKRVAGIPDERCLSLRRNARGN